MDEQTIRRIDRAVAGDREALEALLTGVQDLVFNLSLRMLGGVPDAEDAAQEIMVRVMTRLSTFRKECAFSTWVFRIAVNYLKNEKKSMFSQHPLSFEFYGEDIRNGGAEDLPDLSQGVDKALLEQELKLSCTNVMLQCFTPEDRCIFILGTMFKADSRLAGELLEMSPEAYRQRLSRLRRRMAAFLGEYCGLSGGMCDCRRRLDYAAATRRLDPRDLCFSGLEEAGGRVLDYKDAMERIDDLSLIFVDLPAYRAPAGAREFLTRLLRSEELHTVMEGSE